MHKYLLFGLFVLVGCGTKHTAPVDFAAARKDFKTKILVKKTYEGEVAVPPKDLMTVDRKSVV